MMVKQVCQTSPEFGLEFAIGSQFTNLSYYGYGAEESYLINFLVILVDMKHLLKRHCSISNATRIW
ncbi:MAG: hypothetical protein ACLS5G_08180 [Streptococcus sp.]